MGIVDKGKQAAATAGALAVLVKVTRSGDAQEVDRVTLAGVPLFTRDDAGKPYLFGIIPMKRRRKPRGNP
jgi:hypothetical protein